ncbi:hypothetical protein H0V99_03610 [Candidatus Saccharibacteria bacterium]|nr:hypothetical protein [Candidatus Saccharibacteria bacterium]
MIELLKEDQRTILKLSQTNNPDAVTTSQVTAVWNTILHRLKKTVEKKA